MNKSHSKPARPIRVQNSRMTVARLVAEIAEKGGVNMVAMDFDMSAAAIREALLKLSAYLQGLDNGNNSNH